MVAIAERFIRVKTLKKWNTFKPFRDIESRDFELGGEPRSEAAAGFGQVGPVYLGRVIMNSNHKKAGARHFISHRWSTRTHPDPDGSQLRSILDEYPDDALLWYDYCCLPQKPRTPEEEKAFLAGISEIPEIIKNSWFSVVDGAMEGYEKRSWCQFEALCALQFGFTARSAIRPNDTYVNENTSKLPDRSPAYKEYLNCISRLPRDNDPDGTEVSGCTMHGYYLDVPDLNDKAFEPFRRVFHSLEASDLADPFRLWDILLKLFPPRRLDFTHWRY